MSFTILLKDLNFYVDIVICISNSFNSRYVYALSR